jgi:hypothetical protein
MKTVLAILSLLSSGIMFTQINFGGHDKSVPKSNYNYIIIYREWEQIHVSMGDSYTFKMDWVTKIEGFESWEQLIKWLNNSQYLFMPVDNQRRTRITEDELIAVYDLSKADKVELQFISEEKSLPKRVEIQAEQWTDTEWRKK